MLCEYFMLIGLGLIWNVYFGVLVLFFGFFLVNVLVMVWLGGLWLCKLVELFIFVFCGSLLFIQFFVVYEVLVQLFCVGIDIFGLMVEIVWIICVWVGVLLVLVLNIVVYLVEIFYGVLCNLFKGEFEVVDVYGMVGWICYCCVVWFNVMWLVWFVYINEVIFLFYVMMLVFFFSFLVFCQQGDVLYYVSFFVEKIFNFFVVYFIVVMYFIFVILCLIGLFGVVNWWLNCYVFGVVKCICYWLNFFR